ncbi:RNA polymerase subunit sigma-24 [Streptomyces sp. NBC_00365]|uniref:sigma factor-like helix-turn-helix DNA-binding protein n=1 Tax=Streptomyces sp. NBC_00365 TaxID=2975726 RepID=UPI00224EC4FB|nr:sigma factor-like helix-turn-helix DNA-binding protein [Streptomyces sp. NBC_00365]MCX5096727.1 RNA polymerase subunit sigma-24 [Streptomyces sp. NBC_00365]
MSRAEEFEELRPLLSAIAHRMLGDVHEARDVVREAGLRWENSPAQPATARGFLVAAVTRMSIDILTAAGERRPPHEHTPPRQRAQDEDPLLTAALMLIEELSPLERAVFVLREVLGCGFPQIASALGCTEAACRQLADVLCPVGEDGAAAARWPRHIDGAENVARALVAIVPPLSRIGITLEHHRVDGRPRAVFRDRNGKDLHAVVLLDIADGQVRTIRLGSNPTLNSA